MDLHATAIDFAGGKAHAGMAIGARNILDRIKDLLQEAVDNNPDYGKISLQSVITSFFNNVYKE